MVQKIVPSADGKEIRMHDFVIENGELPVYTGNERRVVIPDGVTSIGKNAFFTSFPNIGTINIKFRLSD